MARRRLDRQKAQAIICEALRAGNTVRSACAYAGVHHDTFYEWLAKDTDFSDSVKLAEGKSDIELVEIIRKAAPRQWQAAAWLLERHPRTKQDWKRIDELDFRRLTTEQLLELAAAVESRIESPGDRVALAGETD